MKKVIYSLYIDIPEPELDYQQPYTGDTISKTIRTKELLHDNYEFLKERQQRYAQLCGVDYYLFEYNDQYQEYEYQFKVKYPFITTYNIVNFYKIQKLYDLSETYNEILYLDFDVVPASTNNFFEHVDLSKGIAISDNFEDKRFLKSRNFKLDHLLRKSMAMAERDKAPSNRSPHAKYWNTLALNTLNCGNSSAHSFNTGIIGCTSDQLKQLAYWEDFDDLILQMHDLINDDLFPDYVRKCFGYDNETVWGHKVMLNDVSTQELHDNWHFRLWDQTEMPEYVNLIHVIDKNFQFVKKWLIENEKINL